MRRRYTSLAIAALCLSVRPAAALVGDSDEAIGLDGSFRNLGGLSFNYDQPALFGNDNDADGFGQSLLRLELAGRPAGALSYELHGLQMLSMSTGQGGGVGGAFTLPTGSPRYRVLSLRWTQIDDGDVQTALDVDRAALTASVWRLDVTVGRQAISFGHTHLWNPTDLYLAWDPSQFDRDYKPGVDAVRVDIALGDFSGVTVLGVAGSSLEIDGTPLRDGRAQVSLYGSSVLLRAFTHLDALGGWDLSAQGGKVYGGHHAGAGFTGEILSVEVRAEAAYLFADSSDDDARLWITGEPLLQDHLQVVAGIGRGFGSGLLLELEYMHNGGPDDDMALNLVRFATGLSPSVTAHLLGAMGSYPLMALLRGQLLTLVSPIDGSVQVLPLLIYSVSDEAEFVAGAFLNFGKRPTVDALGIPQPRSEYGTFPSGGLFEFKLYF